MLLSKRSRELGLLLWKNWLLRKARPFALLVELLLPLTLFAILVAVQVRVRQTTITGDTYSPPSWWWPSPAYTNGELVQTIPGWNSNQQMSLGISNADIEKNLQHQGYSYLANIMGCNPNYKPTTAQIFVLNNSYFDFEHSHPQQTRRASTDPCFDTQYQHYWRTPWVIAPWGFPPDDGASVGGDYSSYMPLQNADTGVSTSGALAKFPMAFGNVTASHYPLSVPDPDDSLLMAQLNTGRFFAFRDAATAMVQVNRWLSDQVDNQASCSLSQPCVNYAVFFTNTMRCSTSATCLDLPSTGPINILLRQPRNLMGATNAPMYQEGRVAPYLSGREDLLYMETKVLGATTLALTGVDITNITRIWVRRFSYPETTTDAFAAAISTVFPLLMVLAWIYTVSLTVKNIVYEKEARLKEAMKMMGLGGLTHWISWYLTTTLLAAISVFLITILLKVGSILKSSDPSLIFVFLMLFALATVSFCFLVSVFFAKAKLAAACAGILYFLTYLPYIFLLRFDDVLTRSQKLVACLMPCTALGMGASFISNLEVAREGAKWNNYANTLSDNSVTLASVMGLLIFDACFYLFLAWYIEAVFPGQYGVPRPWYFVVQPSYWCGPSTKTANNERPVVESETAEPAAEDSCFEIEPATLTAGIDIRALRKTYSNGKVALHGISCKMFEGQVTSLLGHNGAGKTTTMSILTGLFPPSDGTALVNGYDIVHDMDRVRLSLGICPQHNVLWDLLTVEQHMRFFCTLKGVSGKAVKHEVDTMIADLQLEDKRHVKSEALSGGMKRKLSIGLALLGGSKVVILDEPTAGIDPYARRQIWDLILKLKRGRTVLMSTHHMDEADILGDRIVIIADGQLRCSGTGIFLKEKFGQGYHLTFVKQQLQQQQQQPSGIAHEASVINVASPTIGAVDETANLLQQMIVKHVPSAYQTRSVGAEVCFVLPYSETKHFGDLFAEIEQHRDELGVGSYGVSCASLEEVFLTVTEQASLADLEAKRLEDEQYTGWWHMVKSFFARIGVLLHLTSVQKQTRGSYARRHLDDDNSIEMNDLQERTPVEDIDEHMGGASSGASSGAGASAVAVEAPIDYSLTASALNEMAVEKSLMLSGFKLKVTQFRALLLKRLHYAKRDKKAMFSQLVLPALFVMAAMIVASVYPTNLGEFPVLALNTDYFPRPNRILVAFYGPRTAASDAIYAHFKVLARPTDYFQEITEDISSFTMNPTNYLSFRRNCYGAISFDSRLTPDPFADTNTPLSAYILPNITIWVRPDNKYARDVFVTMMHSALLRYLENVPLTDTTRRYSVSIQPFPLTLAQQTTNFGARATDLVVAIMVIIALSFVPASYVLFLVQERVTKSKHLQFVSGVDSVSYWLSSYAFDLIGFLIPSAICILIFLAFSVPAYTGANIGPVIILFLLYGFAMTPLMYCLSFLFDVPSTSYVILICGNVFVGVTTTIATFILELFRTDPDLNATNLQLKYAFLIFPNYCLGRGLMDLAFIQYLQDYLSQSGGTGSTDLEQTLGFLTVPSPFQWDMLGRNMFFMMVEGFVYLALALLLERRFFLRQDWYRVAVMRLKADCFRCCPGLVSWLHDRRPDWFSGYEVTIAQDGTVVKMAADAPGAKSRSARTRGEDSDAIGLLAAEGAEDSLGGDDAPGLSGRLVLQEESQGAVTVSVPPHVSQQPQAGAVAGVDEEEDEDVAAERMRVYTRQALAEGDLVRVKNLTKIYYGRGSKSKVAVTKLTFGVHQHECFGLLGVNGAGKTTTFRMLTGDLDVTKGNARIDNFSILTDIRRVQQNIGYCPQFDALNDLLTARETLYLYARLRGVPEALVPKMVEWCLERMQLLPFATKTAQTLSGGNKRKLSTAIALIGSPAVVFMDEPTTGMDPKARRFLWQVVHALVDSGRSVVFCSHSMEECEVLCNRIAIMVNGKFKCIGSPQHLKSRFGRGYTLVASVQQLNDEHSSWAAQMDAVKQYIEESFPGCVLQEEHQGTIRYQLLSSSPTQNFGDLARVFQLMEQARSALNLVKDYSVNQTTLEQVFVSFAKEQGSKNVDGLELEEEPVVVNTL